MKKTLNFVGDLFVEGWVRLDVLCQEVIPSGLEDDLIINVCDVHHGIHIIVEVVLYRCDVLTELLPL